MKYYIGIDPGTKGAICVWGGCDIVDTLKLSTATDKDIIDFISKYADDTVFAVIEKVGAMPGNGSVSMFKFGRAYGALGMALMALNIPHEHVRPQEWQKGLGLPKAKKKDDHKRNLKAVAEQRFPKHKWTLETCDATLIAEYASNKRAPF
jgi:crossover junction endodeoxyribonuclease RuvC